MTPNSDEKLNMSLRCNEQLGTIFNQKNLHFSGETKSYLTRYLMKILCKKNALVVALLDLES